tara:strand:- start:5557 stop:6282 length:726 start_codon:yes stop_codon:yes gene_type:complete
MFGDKLLTGKDAKSVTTETLFDVIQANSQGHKAFLEELASLVSKPSSGVLNVPLEINVDGRGYLGEPNHDDVAAAPTVDYDVNCDKTYAGLKVNNPYSYVDTTSNSNPQIVNGLALDVCGAARFWSDDVTKTTFVNNRAWIAFIKALQINVGDLYVDNIYYGAGEDSEVHAYIGLLTGTLVAGTATILIDTLQPIGPGTADRTTCTANNTFAGAGDNNSKVLIMKNAEDNDWEIITGKCPA